MSYVEPLYKHVKWIHASLISKDPKFLAEWYKDILGFNVTLGLISKKRPPIYFLKFKNGSEIEIHPEMFKRHICFVVEDFDKAAKTLEAKGIKLEGVRETSVGWKIGYFYDPEGNQLELQMRPKDTPQT